MVKTAQTIFARKRRKAKRAPASKCTLYGLHGPDGVIRYIGQTRIDIKRRLGWHWRNTKRYSTPVCHWIREVKHIEIVALNENATWDVSEIIEIANRRANGEPLLNVTRGGTDTLDDCKREGCVPSQYGDHLRDIGRGRVEAFYASGQSLSL